MVIVGVMARGGTYQFLDSKAILQTLSLIINSFIATGKEFTMMCYAHRWYFFSNRLKKLKRTGHFKFVGQRLDRTSTRICVDSAD